MDSFPTEAAQSGFLVAMVAVSPVLMLFLADAIGRVRQRKARVRPAGGSSAGMGERQGLSGGQSAVHTCAGNMTLDQG
jgi:hypothetical protein